MSTIRPPQAAITEKGFRHEFIYLQYPAGGWREETIWEVAEEPGHCIEIQRYSVLFQMPFTVIVPAGLRFGCLRVRGKSLEFLQVVEWYAQRHGLLTARTENDLLAISDGSKVPVAECQLIEAYIVDGKDNGPPTGRLYTPGKSRR